MSHPTDPTAVSTTQMSPNKRDDPRPVKYARRAEVEDEDEEDEPDPRPKPVRQQSSGRPAGTPAREDSPNTFRSWKHVADQAPASRRPVKPESSS
eukprot:scaffold194806_cov29-Prasinocladus_malaysianus.AAC.1